MRRLPVLIPHRPGCADFPLPVLHGRASLAVVSMTLSVTRQQRKSRRCPLVSILASSAIRCRFVDRFVRLKVLSRVSRQRLSPHGTRFPRSGPGESSSPMSQVLLRCYDFPPRIPGHLFASLPGSTPSSSVRVSQLALPIGRRGLSGRGHCSTGDPLPVHSHVDVNGTSQVSRQSILCLCPALRPRPNRRPLASFDGFVDAAPALPTAKASALNEFRGSITRLWHLLPTLQE
jgi:hypothetical protein